MRRGPFLAMLVVLLVACGDGGSDLCDRLPGTDFRSEENISSILGEDGVEPAPEFFDFSNDIASWFYGDVVEDGDWTCSGDRVSSHDGRFEANLLEEDGRLVLDRDGTRYLEE